MKKIININLSGRVIPIEDTAFEKLKNYIDSLRRYFAAEESREEIINDIESRIAELMNDRIRLGASSISDADMEAIIASMGTIEDFEAVESEQSTTGGAAPTGNTQDYSQAKTEKKRLYRDSSDRFLGGVCSGIATYINIDPAIVRILFAIITFGGFGLGVLAYIILWIVLPPRDLEGYHGKRLFRNPDDKVLGGVAGGLAAYFDKSANVIRLIFAAPLLLNILFGIISWPFGHDGVFFPNVVIGSLTGTFILAYIVLWIVLPEANSPYEKMEMRGEKVDVNSIRQNVREGMGSMRDKMKGWTSEVKESAQQFGDRAKEFANTRGKAFASETSEAAQRASRGIGHAIAVLFKAFFLFVAGSIAFALFVVIIGLIFGGVGFWPFTTYLFDGFWQKTYAWGTLIFFLGIPVIAFIIWLLRRLMKVRSQNNYLGWTFGGLWALGWICVTLFATSMVRDFRMSNYRRPADELPITNPANNRMLVMVSEPEVEYAGSMPWFDIDGRGFDLTQDTLRIANIRIDEVELSPDSNYHVFIKKYSRGSTVSDAEARARRMVYNAFYRDSVLDLGSGLAIDSESKFRGQEVLVTISIPVGGRIQFDETIHKLRHDFDVHMESDEDRRRGRVEIDWDFDYRTGIDYTMGADGRLRDSSGTPVRQNRDGYRYQPREGNDNDSIRLEREIERKKQELQELERKKNESTSFIRKDEILKSHGEEFSGPNVKMEWF